MGREQQDFDASKFVSPAGHPRDRIIVHDSQDIPKEGQFVSLNGYAFLIKPGMEVDIPRPIRLMLDTLIRTDTTQNDDGSSTHRDLPRITYTLLAENVMSESDLKDAAAEVDPMT